LRDLSRPDSANDMGLLGHRPATPSAVDAKTPAVGAARPGPLIVPVADLTIEDTWDVVCLRGTGSHRVAAAEIPVDLDGCLRFVDRPWPDGALWRLPIYTTLLPTLVAVPLGIARGAVDEVSRQAREGRTARRGQMADAPISRE
jgi:indole-3-acetate monooxygenase